MSILSLTRKRNERGFTLVEMMAALLVFSLVTLGLVPLFATSLRGSALSRSYAVGKNVAIEAMERVRGLPFFVSYASKNRRVDILDLYYPNLTGGYSANSYTTTCTTSTVNPGCPTNIPAGMTVTYKATFVRTSTYSTTPVRYDVVAPPAGYRWDSATGADLPPSQLVEVLTRTTWNVGSETKSYELKTLLGDRQVGTTKVRGTARVDYGVQVLTSFDVAGVKSDFSLTGAYGESKVETKLLSTASQTMSAGTLRLVRASDDPTVLGSDLGLSPMNGAASSLHAPPDVTPAGASAGTQTLTHPDWLDGSGNPRTIGWIDSSSTATLKAVVANELPASQAEGKTNTNSGVTTYVDNQVDDSSTSLLDFESGEHEFEIARATRAMQAETYATTTATTAADRKVETSADTKLGEVRFLPVDFINGSDDAVIRVSDFRANATCKSTAAFATASATGSWSATLRYWRDTDPSDNIASGNYTSLTLNSASLGTTITNLIATNPLVFDHGNPDKDIYLFEVPGKLGYLKTLSASLPATTKSADGRTTTVNIDGALRISTVPTDPLNPATAMNVSLGKVSCDAVDNR